MQANCANGTKLFAEVEGDMATDVMVREWEDGHGLYQDQWQWIVKHGRACKQRGQTHYLRQAANVLAELAACGHRVPPEVLVEVTGGPGRA